MRTFIFWSIIALSLQVAPSAMASATTDVLSLELRPLASGSIPKGATRVGMLQVTATAPCTMSARIDTLKVRHVGLGAASQFTSVYVLDGTTRISRGTTFQESTPVATLRLKGFTIPPCASKILTIAADFSADAAAGSVHGLSIADPSDVFASLPVRITSSPNNAGLSVAPSSAGSLDIISAPLSGNSVLFGTDRSLYRFNVKALDKNHALSAITFTNLGSASNADLQNLYLATSRGERATEKVATLRGQSVRLILTTPLRLDRNQSMLLTLKGDVKANRRKTIRFAIEEPSDVESSVVR